MITLLIGENLFKRDAELARIVGDSEVERYTGDEVDESRLVDIFAGATLFATKRVVVVDGLSANKSVWAALPDWLGKLGDETTLVLCELRVDKRTKTYKALQRQAKLADCTSWSLRQTRQAEQWLQQYAGDQGVKLSGAQISEMVARAVRPALDDQPMIDQALLATTVGQLKHSRSVTDDIIDTVMPGRSHDNVFGLLEAALTGNSGQLDSMIEHLKHHQDGHRVMALLTSQGIQLAGLVFARASGVTDSSQVAADIGAHPYALSQLAPLASKLNTDDATKLIDSLAWVDERTKRGGKPWQLIVAVLQDLRTYR